MKKIFSILLLLLLSVIALAGCKPSEHIHEYGEWIVTKRASCIVKGEETRACYCGAIQTLEIPYAEHKMVETEQLIAPTCTKTGKVIKVCVVCDKSVIDTKDALGHMLVIYDEKDPTCTSAGCNSYVVCFECEYSTYKERPALNHNFGETQIVEPTCTANGAKYTECANCGDRDIQEIYLATGHNWVEGNCETGKTCTICSKTEGRAVHEIVKYQGKAASCTESGYKAYECCTKCDYTTYQEIPAFGHDEIQHEGKITTCTESGYDAYVTCSRCDYTTYEEKIAPGHNYKVIESTVTCTEGGYVSYLCECGDAYENSNEPPLGHDEIYHEGKAPTCEEGGYDAYVTCSRCDYTTYSEKGPTGHDYYLKTITLPTCTEDGYTTYFCRCGYKYVDNYVDAPGHIEIHHDGKAPTCTESGYDAYVTCERCSYTTYEEKPAEGHDFVAGTCTKCSKDELDS